jgi:hypothetical protein
MAMYLFLPRDKHQCGAAGVKAAVCAGSTPEDARARLAAHAAGSYTPIAGEINIGALDRVIELDSSTGVVLFRDRIDPMSPARTIGDEA